MNPGMKYQFVYKVYFQELTAFDLFSKSEKNEIMFMAVLMKSKMNISDEEIITQGDEAHCMYFILSGEVRVYIK